MLLLSLVIGLGLGVAAGGNILNLASVRMRLLQLLFLGLVVRYAAQYAIEIGAPAADALRLPLFGLGFLLLLIGLWVNREQPGLPLAFVGILLNAAVIVVNGGYMPVWEPSIVAAGLGPAEVGSTFHRIVAATPTGGIPPDFLIHAGPLGDIIPIPLPFIQNVISIGDLFLGAGLGFFLFAVTVRSPIEYEEAALAAVRRRLGELSAPPPLRVEWPAADKDAWRGAPAGAGVGGLVIADAAAEGALVSQVGLEGAQLLGGSGLKTEGLASRTVYVPTAPPILERVRRHPYVRLALDGSFTALWTGQLVSALGDRIHQVALAFIVLETTGSAIAVGAVFLVATLPNLLFSPIAGGLVDRWDHREVMIVSDLLRAGLVLLIPLAAVTNLALAYPLVFLVTTVSIFFRPAKGAILPRIVSGEDLVAANSALWVGETFADIFGYVVAGLFVAILGSQLPLAFWVDSVTYVASALLIASISVAPLAKVAADKADGVFGAFRRLGGEILEGWRFLRGETTLMANTLQATAGQFMMGIVLALTPLYAAELLNVTGVPEDVRDRMTKEAYGYLEGAIGAGNLVGGFLIGLIGSRLALGKMVIVGYVGTGAMVALLALAGNVPVALAMMFGAGAANLAYVIPSQTLFQRRTPPELMGRVLSFRFSLVIGSTTLAMGVGGVLGEFFGASVVIGVFGLVTVAAGLAGLFVPAVRDA
jgi:MFS transporter, DHA3 family, macrolide efflux protein